jgi:hypothetical protein
MLNDGWIKIYRQILQWEWFDNSKMVHLFLYFLLRANTEDREWRGLLIKRGQFATSVPTISKATGLTEQEIRTCVKRLINAQQIVYNSTYRATHRCVVITICNYESYQSEIAASNEPTNEPPTNLQRTSNEPPTDKQREYKNKKNNRNILISSSKEKDIESADTSTLSADAVAPPATAPEEAEKKNRGLPFAEVKNLWNEICKGYPRIFTLSEARKNKIRNRIAEMGGTDKAMQLMKTIFEKMQSSSFLKGDNKRSWKASFDWVFENDRNWVKVYEGNYDHHTYPSSNIITATKPTIPQTNYGTAAKYNNAPDARAERDARFRADIVHKINSPDTPDPEVGGSY